MSARDSLLTLVVLALLDGRRMDLNGIVEAFERDFAEDRLFATPATRSDVSAVLAALVKQRGVRFERGSYEITARGKARLRQFTDRRTAAKSVLPPVDYEFRAWDREFAKSLPADAVGQIATSIAKRHARQGDTPAGTFARIDAPTAVALGVEFTVVVGISPTPLPNVTGERLDLEGVQYPFTLTIFVAPDRFELRPGESALQRVEVTGPDHFPTTELHVRATGPLEAEDGDRRVIVVCYSVLARTIGYASVSIDVVPSDRGVEFETQHCAPAMSGSIVAGPTPDMTVTVLPVDSTSGRLHWKFESPHLNALWAPVESTMGMRGLEFALDLAQHIEMTRKTKAAMMRGIARRIGGAMPAEFAGRWRDLRQKLGNGRIPTVLIYSQEPYVPWELALVEPLFDGAAPKVLGAQADVGRWVLGSHNRPPVPPPHELELSPIAAVTAVYDDASHQRLPHAEAEGRALHDDYDATPVLADPEVVERCIAAADPPAKIVHFALHGAFDASPQYRGLVMNGGEFLTDVVVEGFEAELRPFIFLNACEVGQGAEMLGHYGGMAAAFLIAGARGVIAPLWKIDDALAKDIALDFYRKTAQGRSPAEYLRTVRAKFAVDPEPTYLAYLLFGHPALQTAQTQGRSAG